MNSQTYAHTHRSPLIRGISFIVCVLFAYVNVVYGAVEAGQDFWQTRRKAAQSLKNVPTARVSIPDGKTTLLAQLPALEINILPRLNSGQISPFSNLSSPVIGRNEKIKQTRLPAIFKNTRVPKWVENLSASHVSIKDLYTPPGYRSGDPMVIHIQDAHGNVEAQRNIARTLQSLSKPDSKLPGSRILIGIEGSKGAFNFAPYRSFDDSEVTQQIADYFLEESLITGSEYVGMTAQELPDFWGIEDEDLYLSHVQALKDSTKIQEKAKSQLKEVRSKLETIKDREMNPALRELDRKITLHHQDKIGLTEHLKTLAALRTSHPRNVRKFLTALKLEDSLDYQKVEAERASLTRALAKNLPKSELENLVKSSIQYRLGNLTHGAFYQYLKDLCSAYGMKFTKWPEMDKYIRYVLLSEKIKVEDFISEVQELEVTALHSAVKTSREKELIKQSQEMVLAEKLVRFELTPEDWETYASRRPSAFLQSFASTLKPFEKFNQAAVFRNEALVKNLLNKADQSLTSESDLSSQSQIFPDIHSIKFKTVEEKLTSDGSLEYAVLDANISSKKNNSYVRFSITPKDSRHNIGIDKAPLAEIELLDHKVRLYPSKASFLNRMTRIGSKFRGIHKQNIKKTPVTSNSRVKPHLSVLVAGGFHTPGMTKILKDKKVAYAVLSPRIGKVEGSGSEYLDVFTRDKIPLEKMFTGERITLAGESAFVYTKRTQDHSYIPTSRLSLISRIASSVIRRTQPKETHEMLSAHTAGPTSPLLSRMLNFSRSKWQSVKQIVKRTFDSNDMTPASIGSLWNLKYVMDGTLSKKEFMIQAIPLVVLEIATLLIIGAPSLIPGGEAFQFSHLLRSSYFPAAAELLAGALAVPSFILHLNLMSRANVPLRTMIFKSLIHSVIWMTYAFSPLIAVIIHVLFDLYELSKIRLLSTDEIKNYPVQKAIRKVFQDIFNQFKRGHSFILTRILTINDRKLWESFDYQNVEKWRDTLDSLGLDGNLAEKVTEDFKAAVIEYIEEKNLPNLEDSIQSRHGLEEFLDFIYTRYGVESNKYIDKDAVGAIVALLSIGVFIAGLVLLVYSSWTGFGSSGLMDPTVYFAEIFYGTPSIALSLFSNYVILDSPFATILRSLLRPAELFIFVRALATALISIYLLHKLIDRKKIAGWKKSLSVSSVMAFIILLFSFPITQISYQIGNVMAGRNKVTGEITFNMWRMDPVGSTVFHELGHERFPGHPYLASYVETVWRHEFGYSTNDFNSQSSEFARLIIEGSSTLEEVEEEILKLSLSIEEDHYGNLRQRNVEIGWNEFPSDYIRGELTANAVLIILGLTEDPPASHLDAYTVAKSLYLDYSLEQAINSLGYTLPNIEETDRVRELQAEIDALRNVLDETEEIGNRIREGIERLENLTEPQVRPYNPTMAVLYAWGSVALTLMFFLVPLATELSNYLVLFALIPAFYSAIYFKIGYFGTKRLEDFIDMEHLAEAGKEVFDTAGVTIEGASNVEPMSQDKMNEKAQEHRSQRWINRFGKYNYGLTNNANQEVFLSNLLFLKPEYVAEHIKTGMNETDIKEFKRLQEQIRTIVLTRERLRLKLPSRLQTPLAFLIEPIDYVSQTFSLRPTSFLRHLRRPAFAVLTAITAIVSSAQGVSGQPAATTLGIPQTSVESVQTVPVEQVAQQRETQEVTTQSSEEEATVAELRDSIDPEFSFEERTKMARMMITIAAKMFGASPLHPKHKEIAESIRLYEPTNTMKIYRQLLNGKVMAPAHPYLIAVLALPFLLFVVGGLYFSVKKIRGSDEDLVGIIFASFLGAAFMLMMGGILIIGAKKDIEGIQKGLGAAHQRNLTSLMLLVSRPETGNELQDQLNLMWLAGHEMFHNMNYPRSVPHIWGPSAVSLLYVAQTENQIPENKRTMRQGARLMALPISTKERAQVFQVLTPGPDPKIQYETLNVYRFGLHLAGMAYELGRQLDDEQLAWDYLKLILIEGMSLEDAEITIRERAGERIPLGTQSSVEEPEVEDSASESFGDTTLTGSDTPNEFNILTYSQWTGIWGVAGLVFYISGLWIFGFGPPFFLNFTTAFIVGANLYGYKALVGILHRVFFRIAKTFMKEFGVGEWILNPVYAKHIPESMLDSRIKEAKIGVLPWSTYAQTVTEADGRNVITFHEWLFMDIDLNSVNNPAQKAILQVLQWMIEFFRMLNLANVKAQEWMRVAGRQNSPADYKSTQTDEGRSFVSLLARSIYTNPLLQFINPETWKESLKIAFWLNWFGFKELFQGGGNLRTRLGTAALAMMLLPAGLQIGVYAQASQQDSVQAENVNGPQETKVTLDKSDLDAHIKRLAREHDLTFDLILPRHGAVLNELKKTYRNHKGFNINPDENEVTSSEVQAAKLDLLFAGEVETLNTSQELDGSIVSLDVTNHLSTEQLHFFSTSIKHRIRANRGMIKVVLYSSNKTADLGDLSRQLKTALEDNADKVDIHPQIVQRDSNAADDYEDIYQEIGEELELGDDYTLQILSGSAIVYYMNGTEKIIYIINENMLLQRTTPVSDLLLEMGIIDIQA